MPTVTNTTGELNARTILLAELAQTISGAKTFDRGGSAPFIVNSGAAKVANLDADKLDGQEGSYFLDLANATGTIGDAQFPATLPALSGANLTNLNASNLTLGTVPHARLGTTGSWTPTDASGAGLTLTVSGASYWRLGTLVIATAWIVYPATASTNTTEIGGLPFTPMASSMHGGYVQYTDLAALILLLVRSASPQLAFFNGGGNNYTNATLSGKQVRFTAIYHTT